MALSLGRHSPKLRAVRALLSSKGRNEQQKFAFEGWTLLHEAQASGMPLEALYVTQPALQEHPSIIELENSGTPVYIVDGRDLARISDVETPSGILAVAGIHLLTIAELLAGARDVLLLADLSDPGNAGTLVRSAEAFGITGVVFGSGGVQPHHPKIVRSAMGSFFRMQLAVASPLMVRAAATTHGFAIVGLDARGEPIDAVSWPTPAIVMVGHERHGLAGWSSICDHEMRIPMTGPLESLNAAVAGSIGLYEASKRALRPRSDPVKTV